jgi:hypothetical protein
MQMRGLFLCRTPCAVAASAFAMPAIFTRVLQIIRIKNIVGACSGGSAQRTQADRVSPTPEH